MSVYYLFENKSPNSMVRGTATVEDQGNANAGKPAAVWKLCCGLAVLAAAAAIGDATVACSCLATMWKTPICFLVLTPHVGRGPFQTLQASISQTRCVKRPPYSLLLTKFSEASTPLSWLKAYTANILLQPWQHGRPTHGWSL